MLTNNGLKETKNDYKSCRFVNDLKIREHNGIEHNFLAGDSLSHP